ncbi:hypothetical protein P0136_09315 [Lentisphaerota bacterium ZTH]|nr:hypothetical protein JYG24_13175 [Lentisphaerota bacterium]WET05562.1 hypothetical protein P0136_09315 [Lentisphaerota bacterium ZTH]
MGLPSVAVMKQDLACLVTRTVSECGNEFSDERLDYFKEVYSEIMSASDYKSLRAGMQKFLVVIEFSSKKRVICIRRRAKYPHKTMLLLSAYLKEHPYVKSLLCDNTEKSGPWLH